MLKVLIVDDEPYELEQIKRMIDWRREGYIVANEAYGSQEAMKLMRDESFDLVFIKIRLPTMDGLELCQYIRKFISENIDIVLMTSLLDYEYVKQAFMYKVTQFLLKPIQTNDLLNIIQQVRTKLCKKQLSMNMVYKEREVIKDHKEDSSVEEKINQYLHLHYMENITIKSLSKKFYVNSAYLGQIFKKRYGLYLKDYLNSIRIKRAELLLNTTDLKIYEIAESIGFASADSFIATFSKDMGVTPQRYRLEKREIKSIEL